MRSGENREEEVVEEEEEERAEPCCRVISLQHGDALCKLQGEIWKKAKKKEVSDVSPCKRGTARLLGGEPGYTRQLQAHDYEVYGVTMQ